MRARRAAVAAVAVAAACAAVVGACSSGKAPARSSSSGFNPFPSSDGSGGSAGASSGPRPQLAVGQCFDADAFAVGANLDARQVHLVVCAGPHQHEVFATFTYPQAGDGDWPGDAVLDSWANDHCIGAFAGYVGIEYDRSRLDIATLRPDQQGWADGDRTVACAVHDADFNLLTAPVKGSAK